MNMQRAARKHGRTGMDMNLQQISGHQTATTPKPQELSLVASIVVEQKWDNVSLHVIRKKRVRSP